jgi:cytochrome c oxidase subunit 2
MIHLSSKDVIHSFSLPEMRVKQDVVPGMTIPIYFTPTMTSAEFLNEIKGTQREKKENWKGYEIACAQLCGNSHYKMVGYLTVETDLEYDTWLAEMSEELDDDEDDW